MDSSNPDFDIIPKYDSIEEIDRELRFFPANVEQAKTLSMDQVQHYNEEGYISGLDVFTEGEAADLRSYFDKLLPWS